jgi:plasmid stabilization system protein ParE
MKYKVSYLPIANEDIVDICDALTDYPKKAQRLFQEMEKKLKLLEDLPHMWPVYPLSPEYRQMILEDHLLFYTVDDNECKIKVYRILYAKRDITQII